MRGLAHPAQQLRVSLVAGTHATRALPFLQQCLQVIQHEQCTPLTQVPHQETEASFEGGRQETQRLGGEHLEALIQNRFTGGSIA